MVFIASISYSKFLHIIAAPFAALVTPERRGAVMMPMDFEDETAEIMQKDFSENNEILISVGKKKHFRIILD